jgi:hypothetical protein
VNEPTFCYKFHLVLLLHSQSDYRSHSTLVHDGKGVAILKSGCLLLACTVAVSYISVINLITGARGSLVVKALGYKPEGHGFET